MNVTVRAAAESDLEEAYDHYRAVRQELADDFVTEFRRAVDRILQFPDGWQPLDSEYRRCRLHRFPYGVIYRIDAGAEEIVVIAVHHLHRRPGSWRRNG